MRFPSKLPVTLLSGSFFYEDRKLNVHCLKHVWFEGPGSIEDWADRTGHRFSVTRLYAGERLPDVDIVDCLVIMGGPMNVYETDRYPFLAREKRFIRQAVDRGKAVLGICLGAQLIADVMGANVFPNDHKEIGWFPLLRPPGHGLSPLGGLIQEGLEVLHWHGDTFDLPGGAVHLAASEACRHQAFAIGDRVIGLQFHMEMTADDLERIVDNCREELVTGKYIQSEAQILDGQNRFAANRRVMDRILDHLAATEGRWAIGDGQ